MKYLIAAGFLVVLALVLVFMPSRQRPEEISPEQLLERILDPSRYISVDEVAGRLIEKDPSLQLIDVRDPEEHTLYSLPSAINIPMSRLLDSASMDLLTAEGMECVFFSNSDLTADQAWTVCTRMMIGNIRVMKGGVNEWFATILYPPRPPESAPTEQQDLYMFRLAASQYFLGGSVITNEAPRSGEPVIMTRKKKKSATEGGC